jgi:formylglycine-generating enzyme required for sulfatase activity
MLLEFMNVKLRICCSRKIIPYLSHGCYKSKSDSSGRVTYMSSNALEWCKDWNAADYYQNSPERNPHGPLSGSYRVICGGSWYGTACLVRATRRGNGVESFLNTNKGFRLVLPAGQRVR